MSNTCGKFIYQIKETQFSTMIKMTFNDRVNIFSYMNTNILGTKSHFEPKNVYCWKLFSFSLWSIYFMIKLCIMYLWNNSVYFYFSSTFIIFYLKTVCFLLLRFIRCFLQSNRWQIFDKCSIWKTLYSCKGKFRQTYSCKYEKAQIFW